MEGYCRSSRGAGSSVLMRAALAADYGTVVYEHHRDESRHIACLACGATRVVATIGSGTGECPRCHYVGWTYVDDLDAYTRRLIMNGALARRRAGAALRTAR